MSEIKALPMKFNDLGLEPSLLKAIQEKAIPIIF